MDHDKVLVKGADLDNLPSFVPTAGMISRLVLDDDCGAKLKGLELLHSSGESFLQLGIPQG